MKNNIEILMFDNVLDSNRYRNNLITNPAVVVNRSTPKIPRVIPTIIPGNPTIEKDKRTIALAMDMLYLFIK